MSRLLALPGPLPLLTAAFAAGLASAHALRIVETAALAPIFPLLGGALLAARHGRRLVVVPLLALAFFSAGAARAPGTAPGPRSATATGPCAEALRLRDLPAPGEEAAAALELEGLVAGAVRIGPTATRTVLEVGRARALPERPGQGGPWIATEGLLVELSMPRELRPLPGDRLRLGATVDDVGEVMAGWRERLDRAGIACAGRVVAGRLAVVETGSGLLATVERLRRLLADGILAVVPDRGEAALVIALSIGERAEIEPAQAERFADSGLAHLLSVSGLNVALVVLGSYRLLSWLLARTPLAARLDPARAAAAICLPLVPAYALLTGGGPPVVRAAIGGGLYLVAVLGGRAPEAWSALAAAALAILAWDPAALHDPSFQLSFAACVGLLALTGGLRDLIPVPTPAPGAPWWRGWLEAPFAAFATTLAATLATLPFLAIHFGRVSLIGLAANVVAVPLGLSLTVIGGAAAALGILHLSWMSPVLWIAAPLAGLLDSIAGFFAALPGARLLVPSPSPLDAVALWGAAAGLAILRRMPRRALAAIASAAIILVAPRWIRAGGDGLLHVHFLPVGQGDCTLLVLPDGSAILVDAGGEVDPKRDVGATRVLPQLLARGVTGLSAIAVSHLHPDHVGGVPSLLRLLPVDEVWTTGRPLEGPFGAPLARALEEHGIPRRILSRGSAPIERAGVRIEILGPPDREGLADDPLLSANDGSLVLRVVHGEVAVLLPGDVEAEGEAALLDGGAPLEAQLLKAPHHGSKTSSSRGLLEAVRPHHVVFCIGRRNRYGFPHGEVSARYRERRCSQHRTDTGPVRFTSDGSTLEVREGMDG